jgi:hypothetical protein
MNPQPPIEWIHIITKNSTSNYLSLLDKNISLAIIYAKKIKELFLLCVFIRTRPTQDIY